MKTQISFLFFLSVGRVREGKAKARQVSNLFCCVLYLLLSCEWQLPLIGHAEIRSSGTACKLANASLALVLPTDTVPVFVHTWNLQKFADWFFVVVVAAAVF